MKKIIIVIITSCLALMLSGKDSYAQLPARIAAIVIENGFKKSVVFTSENQFKKAASTLPVYIISGFINTTKDGIYIDQIYFVSMQQRDQTKNYNLPTVYNNSALTGIMLNSDPLKIISAYELSQQKYRFLKTVQVRYFFIQSNISISNSISIRNIKAAQYFLKSLGYYNCEICNIDGIVGDLSLKAYNEFVLENKLKDYLITPFKNLDSTTPQIHFYKYADFIDYFKSSNPPCIIDQICITGTSLAFSTKCQNNPSTGIQYDITNPGSISLSVSSGNATKTVQVGENETTDSAGWECENFGAEICISSDPTALVSICGLSINREGLKGINITDSNGVGYSLEL